LCRIGPNNRREHVLAKLRNPEPTMPQWKVTLATTKKPKKTAFSSKSILRQAAASVIILKFNDNSMEFNSMILYSNNILINLIQ
jgi:hypothetical protein